MIDRVSPSAERRSFACFVLGGLALCVAVSGCGSSPPHTPSAIQGSDRSTSSDGAPSASPDCTGCSRQVGQEGTPLCGKPPTVTPPQGAENRVITSNHGVFVECSPSCCAVE